MSQFTNKKGNWLFYAIFWFFNNFKEPSSSIGECDFSYRYIQSDASIFLDLELSLFILLTDDFLDIIS
jgi:hypothetical protein